MSGTLRYRITAKTDVGLVRDHNEDNFIVCPDLAAGEWRFDDTRDYVPDEKGAVWVVADGMGGTNAGEVASNIAVEHVKKTFNELRAAGLPSMEASGDVLARTLIAANKAIAEHARKDPSSQGMGTTAVMGWLRGNHLHVSWVGDSRAYLFRNARLHRISRDHSLVQQLVDNGTITEEQAFHHPQSNIILQSLGDGSSDLAPGHAEAVLAKDDVVMLCTDGLNGMVMDADMEAILHTGGALDEVAEKLIAAAKAAGGHDNITVVLARVLDAPEVKVEMAAIRTAPALAVAPVAASTIPTPPKEGRKSMVIYAIIGLLIALAIGYWFGMREGGHIEGEGDRMQTDSLPEVVQGEEAVGGTKEDGTNAPDGKDKPKETQEEEEPVEEVPEVRGSDRGVPPRASTDRTEAQPNDERTPDAPPIAPATDSTKLDSLSRMRKPEEN